MPREATHSQILYIEELLIRAGVSRLHIGDIHTMDDASTGIDILHRKFPLSGGTRAAIFVLLKSTKWTKADMYQAVGVTSLSDGSGATEFDGKRCLRFLETGRVDTSRETRRPDPVEDAVMNDIAAMTDAIKASAPQRRRLGAMPGAAAPAQVAKKQVLDDEISDGILIPFATSRVDKTPPGLVRHRDGSLSGALYPHGMPALDLNWPPAEMILRPEDEHEVYMQFTGYRLMHGRAG